jgi:hypothetical protein
MKKRVSLFAVIAILAMMFAPMAVSAATADDVIGAIKQGITVGGQTRQVPSEYVKLVQDFLAANPQLTAAQLDKTVAEINAAKAEWEAGGSLSYAGLSQATKDDLIAKAKAAAKELGATLTFDGTTIKVVDAAGHTFTLNTKDGVIKQTGRDYTILIGVGIAILVLLGVSLIVARRKNLFAVA